MAWAVVLATCLQAADTTLESSNSPSELIRNALELELQGQPAASRESLARAIELDPECSPPNGQADYIRWQSQWLTPADVLQRVGSDKDLAAYLKQRASFVDTADNHRALAKWCHKRKLADNERLHWTKVLQYQPKDAEALAALDLQLYRGKLLTRKEIVAAKQLAGEQARATKQWQPQFLQWRKAIMSGNSPQRDAAIAKLDKINDPAALPALELVFAVSDAHQHCEELNLLLIATAGRIQSADATELLLRRALHPASERVRAAAAGELRKRPLDEFVPQLIAARPSKFKTKFDISVLPNGAVVYEHEVTEDGAAGSSSVVYEQTSSPANPQAAITTTQMAVDRQRLNAAALEAEVQQAQLRAEAFEARLKFVVQRTMDFASAEDPQLWEKQYNDYRGFSTPARERPTYRRVFANNDIRQPLYFSGPCIPNAEASVKTDYLNTPTVKGVVVVAKFSSSTCFAPGTLVSTIHGLIAIEEIQVGDLVWTQNPSTGEIVPESVQATVLSPASELLNLTLGGEIIRATATHPFWVMDRGWVAAQHLRAGDRVLGRSGPCRIESVAVGLSDEVYNLKVNDHHNYFVGEQQLLVHDSSPLIEFGWVLAGMAIKGPHSARSYLSAENH